MGSACPDSRNIVAVEVGSITMSSLESYGVLNALEGTIVEVGVKVTKILLDAKELSELGPCNCRTESEAAR